MEALLNVLVVIQDILLQERFAVKMLLKFQMVQEDVQNLAQMDACLVQYHLKFVNLVIQKLVMNCLETFAVIQTLTNILMVLMVVVAVLLL
jgi:hypothetical protein